MKRQACAAAVLSLMLSPAFATNTCTQRMTAGTWAARCDGELPGPAGIALTRTLATCTTSRDNYWRCTANVNLGGVLLPQTLEGQGQNNADCTGFIRYEQTVGGQPAPPLDIDYVVLEDGAEIWGLPRPAQAGAVIACSLKRISKGGGGGHGTD